MISERSTFFFFNDTATTEIYPLSLHDALPICADHVVGQVRRRRRLIPAGRLQPVAQRLLVEAGLRAAGLVAVGGPEARAIRRRSEEHTSELQSRQYLVCRLLLEKKTQ